VAKKTIEVTREQVRLAKTKVEADAKSGRTSDPMIVLVARARGRHRSSLHGRNA